MIVGGKSDLTGGLGINIHYDTIIIIIIIIYDVWLINNPDLCAKSEKGSNQANEPHLCYEGEFF